MDKRYKNFLSSVRYLIWLFLVGLFLFLISRLAFLFVYGDFNDLSSSWPDVIYAFVFGLKFDFKVLTFAFLPLCLLCLLQLLNNSNKIIYGFYYRMSLYYGLFVLTIISLISVIDFNFYKFFNTRISVLLFGIVENDTNTVLKTVRTDFPVILILLSLLIFAVLLFFLLKWLFRKEVKWVYIQSTWLRSLSVLLFLGIYIIGLRGAIGIKPLDVQQSAISKNAFINSLSLNGVFVLKTAFADKTNSKISNDIPSMLKHNGLESPKEIVEPHLNWCVDFQRCNLFFKWETDSTNILLPLGTQSIEKLDSLYLKEKQGF